MKQVLLLVDDDPAILDALKDTLAREDLEILACTQGSEALLILEERTLDLVLCDLVLPDVSGMEILKRLQEMGLSTPCLLMTGHATVASAVEALKTGAYDYILKPFNPVEIRHAVEQALQRQRLLQENIRLQSEMVRLMGLQGLIGRSKAMQELFGMMDRVKDLDATVLITGESGTGKEVLARALHASGNRKDRPFVGVNCGAIPENLMEDELFGHVKGAFTDAHAPRMGVFEAADTGILFLDEVGTLRLDLQVKLLRVLQQREFRPIGSPHTRKVDVRVVAATNSDLKEMTANGRFREDLYYRLHIIPIHISPLRERPEDILPLVGHFTKRVVARTGLPTKTFSRRAMETLLDYAWPGNVRELENVVERSLILSAAPDRVELEDLPTEVRWNTASGAQPPASHPLPVYVETMGLDAYLKRMERSVIVDALERHRWRKSKAAESLKLQRTTFVEKMKRLEIPLKPPGTAGKG